eukprot:COSAG06_NODE_8455_length_2169_cov_12.262802_3_plen_86_part_00
MYYAAIPNPDSAFIMSASSTDGLAWKKDPLPAIAPGGQWDRYLYTIKTSCPVYFRKHVADPRLTEERYPLWSQGEGLGDVPDGAS